MAKNQTVPYRGGTKPSPIQPQWGKIGDIRFKWKDFTGHGHSEPERRDLEALLTHHFRKIGIFGDFSVQARAQKGGTSDTKGLTVIGSLGVRNDVQFAYQPGDNGSRLSYAIIFPERMVHEVHKKFMESVAEDRQKKPAEATPSNAAGIVMANMAAMTSAAIDMAAQAMEAMLHPAAGAAATVSEEFPSYEFRDVTGELVILQLKFDTTGVETQPLCHELQEVLTKHGSGETIFTIKRSSNVHTPPRRDELERIKWCILQPGSLGLGFFYRANVAASWEKFALVPDPSFDFDLQRFSDAVSGKGPHLTVVNGGKGGVVTTGKKFTGVNDYANDGLGATLVLTRMSQVMVASGVNMLPAKAVTGFFRTLVSADVDPGAIGRILTHWEKREWIKRYKDKYIVEYSLGTKADTLLPVTNREAFYKLYPRRRPVWVDVTASPALPSAPLAPQATLPAEQIHVLDAEEAVVVTDVAPAVSAAVAVVTSHAVIRTEVPDYDSLADKLQKALVRLQSVQMIKDEIVGFDAQIDAVEAEIAALESRRTALSEARAAAFARLPTTEELQKMQALASLL